MRIFSQALHTNDAEEETMLFPTQDDLADFNFQALETNSANLAPFTDQHKKYIETMLAYNHTFATDITEQQATVYFHMTALILAHAKVGRTIHIVPTNDSALRKQSLMNSISPNTAIAVLRDISYEKGRNLISRLKGTSSQASIIMTAEDLTDSKIGEDIMATLKEGNSLARFVIYQVGTIIDGTLEQEMLCEYLKKNSKIPVMSWAPTICQAHLFKVLLAVGMHYDTSVLSSAAYPQPITYINYADNSKLLSSERKDRCDKLIKEEFDGDSRDMSVWAIKTIEMLKSNKPLPMALTSIAHALIGRGVELKRYGKRAHFKSSAGFEPITLIKIGMELEWLGALHNTRNQNLMDVLSDSVPVALLLSGQLQLHLPIKQIYIYVYTGKVKGELIDDLEEPSHVMETCPCNVRDSVK